MNNPRNPVNDFDLSRHAVVEASAGTGKTFTIERLVVRLLTEQKVPLEKILVVTFTEKATGELKTRLRGAIERELQDDKAARQLRPALDHFDQANIFTIHGFCQRLLQDHALEQGQDFGAGLIDDVELLRILLREIQRKHWRTHFGDSLQSVLERSLYNRDTARDWDFKVLEIAKRFKERCGHRLLPAFAPEWWRSPEDANGAGQLELFTIQTLHEQLRDFKRQRGLQSFDDMIAAVEENLDAERNGEANSFLATLRERYQYGIVDEFQDTDPLQWRIFRRIFLDAGPSKLFIVGDPKQAIFGFRGADLPTYLDAAKVMHESHDAVKHPLAVNWRSDANMLEALNCLFENGSWFAGTGIDYTRVGPPKDDTRPSRLDKDDSNRAALTIVDMTHCDRLKLAQKQYARFVAHEIRRLLGGASRVPLLSIAGKDKPARPLHAGDICILVLKRTDADVLIPALDQVGVPYSFYKQTGVWQSEEAMHLEVLLRTLARPEERASLRKALLTCFFRVKPEELVRAPDLPSAHPARTLYQTWLGHAEKRAWSSLCQSLLEDTGLLAAADPGSERRVATMRHLLATLEQVGHGANLDLLGLLDWLDRRRQQRDSDDADLHPVDMDQPKVKIMTIHASKGLEFPIVFLAGGFTQGRIGSNQTSYHDDDRRLVFDLRPESDARARVAVERLSEQRRLLYVALTRPMFKLYVPKVKPPRNPQFLGPLGTVLLPALELAKPDHLGNPIAEIITPPLGYGAPKAVEAPPAAAPTPRPWTGKLFPAIDANVGRRRIVTRSFSSMAKHHLSDIGAGSSFGEQTPRPEDETAVPGEQDDPLRGPVFGDMVHKVLEGIDFAEVGRAASPAALCQVGTHARKLLDEHIRDNIALLRSRTPLDSLQDACRQRIATYVWQALTTPLGAIGVPLCKIPREDRRAEIEFLYPEHNDARLEERFVTGFMDLLFRAGGKYYLLDWKTNLLPAYTRTHLEQSMNDSDYHRQYRLYLQAIRRWLGSRGEFDGVYYLYVRGMNGRDESAGVFFHRPVAADLDLTLATT